MNEERWKLSKNLKSLKFRTKVCQVKSHLMIMEMIQLTPVPCSLVARGVPGILAAVCSASPAHGTTVSRPQGKRTDYGMEQ